VLVTGGQTVCDSLCVPLASAELYTPVTQGLVTSQTGLTFRAAQGAGTSVQNVVALSATDTIPFTVSTKTYSGGSWLGTKPGSAMSGPGAPATVMVIADATGLAAQDYYGVVTLTPTDGQHPPVSIAVVLTVVPAGAAAPPAVTPSGLVFLAITGTNAKPQAFTRSPRRTRWLTQAAGNGRLPLITTPSASAVPASPAVKSGDPASFTTLSRATAPVAVTIGGQPAVVQFAGLTPGFSWLSQVNAVVPGGVTAGGKVPATVSGSSSPMGIYMAVK
jgi:uncharacterized protein (TIGR03437 family)